MNGNFVQQIIDQSIETTTDFTVQLFFEERSIPRPTGTGILLLMAKRWFIVTAAHVFRFTQKPILVCLSTGKQIELPREIARLTALPGSQSPEDDKFDIAVVEVPQTVAHLVTESGKKFATLSDTDRSEQLGYQRYTVSGIIAAKSKVDLKNKTIFGHPFKYSTTINHEFNFHAHGLNRNTHLPLLFDGEVVSEDIPHPHRAPDLKGISGCGVWGILQTVYKPEFILLQFDCTKNRKLVGIVIEVNKKPNGRALIAVRINFVLNFICTHFNIGKWKRVPFI